MDETIATLRKIDSFPSFVTDYAADIKKKPNIFISTKKSISSFAHEILLNMIYFRNRNVAC